MHAQITTDELMTQNLPSVTYLE